MRNAVKMAVNSCKEMYDERKNLANISVMSSRVMISAVLAIEGFTVADVILVVGQTRQNLQ